MSTNPKADKMMEDGFALFMTGIFLLRQDDNYQEAYTSLGTMLDLVTIDRADIRSKYKVTD